MWKFSRLLARRNLFIALAVLNAGESTIAIRLFAKIREALSIDIQFECKPILDDPSLESLAYVELFLKAKAPKIRL